jgi:hypothetical protein
MLFNDAILTAEVTKGRMKRQENREQCVGKVLEEGIRSLSEDTIRIYKEIFHKILQPG